MIRRIVRTAGLAAYYANRQSWMLRPDLVFLRDLSTVTIDRPIFLVGLQGGGGSVISRMLRRSPEVVTVGGGRTHWTGPDEMQSALGPALPWQFTGIIHKVQEVQPFGRRRAWSYACDLLLPYYKMREGDASDADAAQFRRVIKATIAMRSKSPDRARFLDKSQSYALKIPLIRQVLADSSPRFVGIVRHPYATCWRAAVVKPDLTDVRASWEYRLEVAAQHWRNTVAALLEQQSGEDFMLLTVESFLAAPEDHLRELCEFVQLEFNDGLLPRASDRLPWATKRRDRWYPLRSEINNRYLESITDRAKDVIDSYCGEYAAAVGYDLGSS